MSLLESIIHWNRDYNGMNYHLITAEALDVGVRVILYYWPGD